MSRMASIKNPIASQNFIRSKELANIAAGDAKHDIKRTFVEVFAHFKDIGTPIHPDTPLDEITVLDSILHFKSPPQVRSPANLDEDYREAYLNRAFDGKKDDSGAPFQIFNNSASYKWKSWTVGKKVGEDTVWAPSMTAETLYDWLDVKGGKKIAFTIDATNVPFYRVFQLPKGNPSIAARTAYNIITREAINDPAGKGTRAEYSSSVVNIIDIMDDAQPGYTQNIFYPHLPERINSPYDFRDCFLSKFDISVSAISKQAKLNKISILFSTERFHKQISILKGAKEDANSNSITNTMDTIQKMKINSSSTIDTKNSYFMALQQKRSGDWLQVLACLDRGRYKGLPSDIEIFLVTHDRICLAYALIMGVNVVYSQFIENQCYLTYFYKETEQVDPITVLSSYITNIHTKFHYERINSLPSYINYRIKRGLYISAQSEIYTKLNDSLLLELSKPVTTKDGLKAQFIEILQKAVDISVFLEIMPVLETDEDKDIIAFIQYIEPVSTPILPPGTSVGPIYEDLNMYLRNIEKLKKHPEVDTTKALFLSPTWQRTRANYSKDNRTAIKNIVIFPGRISGRIASLFQPKTLTDKRLGVGVFTFLYTNLKPYILNPIIAWFGKDYSFLQAEHEKTNWIDVRNTALLCLQESHHTAPDIETSDILTAVHNSKDITIGTLDSISDPSSPVDSEEKSFFLVSDFSAAVLVAAKKAIAEFDRIVPTNLEIETFALSEHHQSGGMRSGHNPHTTFYFLLRELGFRMAQSENEHTAVYNLAHFIFNSYQRFTPNKFISEREYFKRLEFFVLKTLPKIHIEFNEIITDVLKNYYGIHTLPETYSVKSIPVKFIKELFDMPAYNPSSRFYYVQHIDNLMENIIVQIENMEALERYHLPKIQVPRLIDTNVRQEISVGGKSRKKKDRRSKTGKNRKSRRR